MTSNMAHLLPLVTAVGLLADVKICGGVTIGEGCVIGAGSVVTRDIPPHSLAVGNPCRVIRQITENDSIYRKNLF